MKDFIIFNTKAQALNFIKRKKRYLYNYCEGCGCCFNQERMFLDGNKVVSSYVNSHAGNVSAEATVIGKIRNCR